MADKRQWEILQQGVEVWNQWRAAQKTPQLNSMLRLARMISPPDPHVPLDEQYPDAPINLNDAEMKGMNLDKANLVGANLERVILSEASLNEADLSGSLLNWADLRLANLLRTDLSRADLRQADLLGANLSNARLVDANMEGLDLREAHLYGANLERARLDEADLRDVTLHDVSLRRASLKHANLRQARLQEVSLLEAELQSADLGEAYLDGADLTGADLRSARLQGAVLDGAVLTGAKLWEIQRSGWSIKGVICEYAFWDEAGKERVDYAPGEFERLYGSQMKVELVYPGGISAFEVNTLPALLQHLADQYPDRGIRLRSIEETGGGVKVSIHVDEVDTQTLEAIGKEAKRAQGAQIALRDRPAERLEIEKQMMLSNMLPRMLAAAGQTAIDRANTLGAKESERG